VRTRTQLVAAARGLLGDRGLAGAPTAAVAVRARVSHGALFRDFPHKTDLCWQAIRRPARRVRRELGPTPAGDPLTAACAALWRVFRRPDMRVVLEIYVAARTDGELARGLAPVLAHHQALLIAEARRLFPAAAAGNPEFDDAVMAIVYAMQGAAIGLFSPQPDAEIVHLAFLERLARRELARRPPPSPHRKQA
jgi:AcrR family transcriptional regulator